MNQEDEQDDQDSDDEDGVEDNEVEEEKILGLDENDYKYLIQDDNLNGDNEDEDEFE